MKLRFQSGVHGYGAEEQLVYSSASGKQKFTHLAATKTHPNYPTQASQRKVAEKLKGEDKAHCVVESGNRSACH